MSRCVRKNKLKPKFRAVRVCYLRRPPSTSCRHFVRSPWYLWLSGDGQQFARSIPRQDRSFHEATDASPRINFGRQKIASERTRDAIREVSSRRGLRATATALHLQLQHQWEGGMMVEGDEDILGTGEREKVVGGICKFLGRAGLHKSRVIVAFRNSPPFPRLLPHLSSTPSRANAQPIRLAAYNRNALS